MPPIRPPGHKTYTRFATGRRMPSEYEIVSSDLHYNYPDRFELDDNPVAQLVPPASRGFAAALRRLGSVQRSSPHHVPRLQRAPGPERGGRRRSVTRDRRDRIRQRPVRRLGCVPGSLVRAAAISRSRTADARRVHRPARPASRITNCAAFQAADEIRRLQRTAYRTAQLASHRSGIDTAAHRHAWETAAELQPLREFVERALVTYDWGESLVATNAVLKPHLDRFINQVLAGALAAANGDPILQSIHFSLDEDARWHRQWTKAVLDVAIGDTETNASVISGWVDRWRPLATASIEAFAAVVAQAPVPLDPAEVTKRITTAASDELGSVPEPPPGTETTG